MNSPTRPRAADFVDAPLRGAPLVVLLILLATGSGLVAGGVAGTSWLSLVPLAVLMATLLVTPVWMGLLAGRSWPPTPPRPQWFELAVRSAAVLFLVGVFAATVSALEALAWSLFVVHVVFTLAVAPIEMRRYPGILPRANGENG